jgi:hypothetical protein
LRFHDVTRFSRAGIRREPPRTWRLSFVVAGRGGLYAVRRDARERDQTALKRIALIFVGVLLFLAISGALARFLSVENVERDDEAALLLAQVRGEPEAMLDQLDGCRQSASCVATVRINASKLRRAGEPKILSLKSPTAYSLMGATGTTRLAWGVIGHAPVVQCVDVRRTGNALTGIEIKLLSLSAPISNSGDC